MITIGKLSVPANPPLQPVSTTPSRQHRHQQKPRPRCRPLPLPGHHAQARRQAHRKERKLPLPGGHGQQGSGREVGTRRTAPAPEVPGVTPSGLKAVAAPAGKPEADIVTTLSKGRRIQILIQSRVWDSGGERVYQLIEPVYELWKGIKNCADP